MAWRVLAIIGFAFIAAPGWLRAQENPLVIATFGSPSGASVEPMLVADRSKEDALTAEVKVSPNTGMPRLQPPRESNVPQLAELALQSSEYIDPRYVANAQHPDDAGFWELFRMNSGEQLHRMWNDAKNFYWSENLLYVGASIAIAAPLANTHADQGIRDWYQAGVGQGRSPGLDETSKIFKWFGDYQYTVPAYIAMGIGGHLFPDCPTIALAGEFGNRSLRAMAIGAPTVGILQAGLGASRPLAGDSSWHPFQSNKSVSGHAFVGAIPFLTAASMVESRPLKALLFIGSFGTAWGRLHDDDHYFSQCFLGWAIAYLAVEAVNQTEREYSNMRIVPFSAPNAVGMGIEIQY